MKFNFEKARINLFKSGFTQKQVDSINAIVNEANSQGIKLKTQLAYILATAYHECYNPKNPSTRLTPMEEFGGTSYLKSKKYWPYYGRGFVQLTWKENYEKYAPKVKSKFGLDIIRNPDILLDIKVAAYVAVDGMIYGRFTGKKLNDYISGTSTNYESARRIINGTDKASLIADYAREFEKCIDKIVS